jgi:pyruvate/2-oxoglutarate dehydrogenase complex dihydrolipoamide dehydrogenase (E3) component
MNDDRSQTDYDMIILGGGPAGGAAAAVALSLNKSVAVVERDRLGGT